MADIGKIVDKQYESQDFADLVKAPISALEGVSEGDAEALQKALNIKTIGDLATNKFVLRAQAIANLAK